MSPGLEDIWVSSWALKKSTENPEKVVTSKQGSEK